MFGVKAVSRDVSARNNIMKYCEKFRVQQGSTVRLDKINADFKDNYEGQTLAMYEIKKYTQCFRAIAGTLNCSIPPIAVR